MSDGLKIGILGIVVALAIAAFWYFGRDAGSLELGDGRGTEAEEIDDRPVEPVIPRRVAEQATPVPDLVAEELPDELKEAEPEAANAAALEVTIEIKLIGPDEKPRPKPDGSLRIQLYAPESNEGRFIDCEVEEGIARIRVAADDYQLRVASMKVGEAARIARSESGGMIPRAAFENGRCRVTLRLVPRVDLQILAAEDRHALDEIRVLRPTSWGPDTKHPGSFESMRLVAEGDSPLAIDVEESGTHSTYWVLAEGRAALPVHFDQKSEGERIVLVEPGGELEVIVVGEIRGIPAALMPKFRLRDLAAKNDYELTFEIDWDGTSPLRIDHLPVGSFALSLESGELWEQPVVVARKEIEISERGRTRVRLEPELEALRVTLASVSGRVVLPAGQASEDYVQIQVRLANPRDGHPTARAHRGTTIDRSQPRFRRFADLSLLPDAYIATVLGQEFPFEVPEGGRDDLVFRIEPREVIEVILRMEGETETIENAQVSWFAGAMNGQARWNSERKAYLASPPEGPITLMIWVGDSFQQVEIDQAASRGRVEVVIKRSQAFELVLKCGDLVIPNSFELPLVLETEDGKPVSIRSATSDGDSITRNLDAAGRYRLTLKEAPAGYRVKAPLVFEVKAGETKRVVLELLEDR